MDHAELRSKIAATNKAFYERVFKDPWLAMVFSGVAREHIENQQTDFMLGAFGGPKVYNGKSPSDVHTHIFVDEEMWQLREQYLKEAFVETNLPEELRAKWIKIDEAFKRSIVKKRFDDCKKRYFTDTIIYLPSGTRKKAS